MAVFKLAMVNTNKTKIAMFTGIIQCVAEVTAIKTIAPPPADNLRKEIANGKIFTVSTNKENKLPETKLGESRAIDGVCTTVITLPAHNSFQFYASAETLAITTLKYLKVGSFVNLELPLKIGATLDGHLVSGHVDKTVVLLQKTLGESNILRFALKKEDLPFVINKGSVTLAGVSLTVYRLENSIANNTEKRFFEVMLIPHTYNNTTLKLLQPNDEVNIEFDMMGKYALRYAQLKSTNQI